MRRSSLRVVVLTLAMAAVAPAAIAQTVSPPAQPEPAPSEPVAPPAPVPGGPQPVQPAPTLQAPAMPEPVKPPPTPQVPLEPQPVQPPPAPPLTAPPPAPPVQQQSGVPDPKSTLAGKPGDASDVDEVDLKPRTVLMLAGRASWDDGFKQLSESATRLRSAAEKAGLKQAGRPLTLFVETDDNGFRFEAMLPVDRVLDPAAAATLGEGIRQGQSPAGRSLRFVHVAPYDDIDSTYETITAYLDAKGITVKDAFLEEYVGELTDPGDPNLEINVYVQPR